MVVFDVLDLSDDVTIGHNNPQGLIRISVGKRTPASPGSGTSAGKYSLQMALLYSWPRALFVPSVLTFWVLVDDS